LPRARHDDELSVARGGIGRDRIGSLRRRGGEQSDRKGGGNSAIFVRDRSHSCSPVFSVAAKLGPSTDGRELHFQEYAAAPFFVLFERCVA
jgi:hypothetical protein